MASKENKEATLPEVHDETEAKVPATNGDEETKTSIHTRTSLNDTASSSRRVDPPPMGSPVSQRSSNSSAQTNQRNGLLENHHHGPEATRGTILQESSVSHELNGTASDAFDELSPIKKVLPQHLAVSTTTTAVADEDILPSSAADTSICTSIDPVGAVHSHRHKKSLVFSDLSMIEKNNLQNPRNSIGLSTPNSRSPSPLSDAGDNIGEEPEEEISQNKTGRFIPELDFLNTQLSIGEEEEEKKSPDKVSLLPFKNIRDSSAPMQEQSDAPLHPSSQHSGSSYSNRHVNLSPLDGDSSLPPMIYQRSAQMDQASLPIPPLPALVAPTAQRTGMAPAQIPQHIPQYGHHQFQGMQLTSPPPMMMGGGKRKIHLRLIEDVQPKKGKRVSFLTFRRKSRGSLLPSPKDAFEPTVEEALDRGRVTVSWYDGTTSLELYEHVRNSVIRKLGLHGTLKLTDLRILDEAFDPPEEIVLSPYIPDGSRLLLRFSLKDKGGDVTPDTRDYDSGPPASPSAAPSPYPSSLDLNGLGLNPNQLALLGARLQGQRMSRIATPKESSFKTPKAERNKVFWDKRTPYPMEKKSSKDQGGNDTDDDDKTLEISSLHPEDPIEKSLRQITELLIADRSKTTRHVPRQEKRQVVFVLANYFVLFLSLIAISAEIQAKIPEWHASIEQHLTSVQQCSKDEDSLYECVSKGDLAGLIASVVLWISRSAATRRIFLFGFDSPQKLWNVVYECLVSAFCWGFSYMFIRRGMNPDTNRNFLQKYWKDAVYGSLAGFNAAFLKHVLKNLIPQEAIEDALMQDRKLKILSWLKG